MPNKKAENALAQQVQVGKKLTEQEIREQILNALPAHLLADVPVAVMRRVNALKNVQVKLNNVEAKFYEELHLLECKYQSKYDEIYEKRKQIITGDCEPTEEESKWTLDQNDDEEGEAASAEEGSENQQSLADKALAEDLKTKINLSTKDIKGVPDFWLATFKSVDIVRETIQEYDEPILKHLYDLRVRLHDTKPYGYTLEFYFNDNEFFTNKVLTKTYELKMDVDPKDPFAYEGPDEYKNKGCQIDWKKGKNVTVHVEKKKQKHKQSGSIRVVTKEVKQESFFNYFDTPKKAAFAIGAVENADKQVAIKSKAADTTDELTEEEKMEEALLAADFELGELFKERIVPRGILYFTGELVDDAFDFDEDEDDEDEDDEDDDDDDDDDDDGMHHKHHGGKGHIHSASCAHGHGPAKGTPKVGAGQGAKLAGGGNQPKQVSTNPKAHQSLSGNDSKDQPPECKQN